MLYTYAVSDKLQDGLDALVKLYMENGGEDAQAYAASIGVPYNPIGWVRVRLVLQDADAWGAWRSHIRHPVRYGATVEAECDLMFLYHFAPMPYVVRVEAV